ncbi:MAG TPA: hypothetical protein VEL76_10020 [Gemmataceae bacterium]|nr:hypothetical protein [Gemmataceae bacterium]
MAAACKNHCGIRVVVAILAGVVALGAGPAPVLAQWPPTLLLCFDLDAKAPPRELLPPPPKTVPLGS